MRSVLLTITETADLFETTVATVRGLIRAHGLKTKRALRNGKGLDLSDLRVIARALNRPEPTAKDLWGRLAAVA